MKDAVTWVALLCCGLLGGYLLAQPRGTPAPQPQPAPAAVREPHAEALSGTDPCQAMDAADGLSPAAFALAAPPLPAASATPAPSAQPAPLTAAPSAVANTTTPEAAPSQGLPEQADSVKNGTHEKPDAEPVLTLKGRVVSNLDVDVKCKVSGQIQQMAVDVGDVVKPGQLICTIDPIDEERALRRTQLAVSASEARLEQSRQNLIISEQTLKTSRARLDATLRMQEARAERAQQKLERLKEPLARQFISKEEFDEAQADATIATASLDSTKAQYDDLKTQELSLALRRQDVRLAEHQLEIDRLTLNNAQQRVQDTRLVAPCAGIVTYRYVQSGSVIIAGTSTQGTRIVTVSDVSRLFVVVPVEAAQISSVRAGQHVDVRCEGFSDRAFRGSVAKIAPRGTASPAGVTFEVKIEILDDNRHLLMPEMPATVVLQLGSPTELSAR